MRNSRVIRTYDASTCSAASASSTGQTMVLHPDEAHDGHARRLAYDHVVIACGRSVNLGSVPGMSDHAFALKNVGDAMAKDVAETDQHGQVDAVRRERVPG